jgi:WD40 repeat protein
MNYSKLYAFTQEKFLTDLVLTLANNDQQLILNVHKVILCSECIYFEKLFSNFQEKDYTSITIQVSNIHAAYDVIMSLYGQKTNSGMLSETRHLLEFIKCQNFFGLDFDQSLMYNIEVEEEDFELLLDIIDLAGYNENMIKIINKNLPEKYDLTKFPKELLDEMLRLDKIHYVVSGSSDGPIKIWNNNTNDLVRTIKCHSGIRSMVCSPDNKLIASGDETGDVEIWDSKTYSLLSTLNGHIDGVISLCFSPDSKQIASGSYDETTKIWDIMTNKIIYTFYDSSYIWSVCYSSDGKYIVSGNNDNNIRIWDVNTGNLIKELCGNETNTYCVRYSPDNKVILSGGINQIIELYNAETFDLFKTISCNNGTIFNICFSHDGKFLAVGNDDIYIYSVETCMLVKILECNPKRKHHRNQSITCLCYSEDDQFIVSGSEDHTVKVWEIETGKIVRNFTDHNSTIANVCWISRNDSELSRRIMATY